MSGIHQGRAVRSRRHAARHRARLPRIAERSCAREENLAPLSFETVRARFRTAAMRWCGSASARCRPEAHEAMRMRLLNIYRQRSPNTRACSKAATRCSPSSNGAASPGASSPTSPAGSPIRCWSKSTCTTARAPSSAATRLPERKPHPLPLLHAAKTMGVEPARMRVRRRRRTRHAGRAGRRHVSRWSRASDTSATTIAPTSGSRMAGSTRRSNCSTGSTSRRADAARRERSRRRMNAAWIIASSPRSPRRVIGYLVGTLRAARRAQNLCARARSGTRAHSPPNRDLRARTAELLAQSEAQVRAGRRERFAPGARRQQRNLPQARARSLRTRPGRGQRHAQGTRRSHHATGRAASRWRSRKPGRTGAGASNANAASPPASFPDRSKTCVKVQASCSARRAICRRRCAGRKCAAAGARSRCVAWSNSPACPSTAISPSRNSVDAGERGALRPDLLVRMPDSRSIVVDAKTPLDAYLDAVEAPDDETRRARAGAPRAAGRTARARTRPEELLGTVRAQPGVRGAVPAGRSVPVGGAGRTARPASIPRSSSASSSPRRRRSWRCSRSLPTAGGRAPVTENAREIRELGQDLHKRAHDFVNHLQKVGRSLGNAVESFNAAVGSLERNVHAAGAQVSPSWASTTDAPLAPVDPIEKRCACLASGAGARSRRRRRHIAHTFMNDIFRSAPASAGAR